MTLSVNIIQSLSALEMYVMTIKQLLNYYHEECANGGYERKKGKGNTKEAKVPVCVVEFKKLLENHSHQNVQSSVCVHVDGFLLHLP